MYALTGIAIATIAVVAMTVMISKYLALWIRAMVSGAHIPLIDLFMMSLRRVDPAVIVQCLIMARQAGLPGISERIVETQYLAGGNVQRIILALIAASRAELDLDWDTAAAIDLAGRDIMEAVQISVHPQVIDCPSAGDHQKQSLCGVARDGIQLMVRARVTVRTNLSQLVGGATEATIIARVGQSIISAIGACDSYLDALADPSVITRYAIAKGLDSQTAFAIVSIDIADINVGENIGAKLRVDQAEADIRIARAAAEKRRAAAVALEQEMTAQLAASRAGVIEAESLVELALAQAIRSGQFHSFRFKRRSA